MCLVFHEAKHDLHINTAIPVKQKFVIHVRDCILHHSTATMGAEYSIEDSIEPATEPAAEPAATKPAATEPAATEPSTKPSIKPVTEPSTEQPANHPPKKWHLTCDEGIQILVFRQLGMIYEAIAKLLAMCHLIKLKEWSTRVILHLRNTQADLPLSSMSSLKSL